MAKAFEGWIEYDTPDGFRMVEALSCDDTITVEDVLRELWEEGNKNVSITFFDEDEEGEDE